MDLPISCSECKLLYFQNKINGIDTLTVTDLISYHGVNHQVLPKSIPAQPLLSSSSSVSSVTVASVVSTNHYKHKALTAVHTRTREVKIGQFSIHFAWFILDNESKEQLYLPVKDLTACAGYTIGHTTRLAGPYGSTLIKAHGVSAVKNYFTFDQALEFVRNKLDNNALLEFIQKMAQMFEQEQQQLKEVDAMLQ